MNIYTVSFFGHRYMEGTAEIDNRLDKLLHDLIWTAIDYEINSPHADELNTIWNKWNSDVNYFPDIENISDIYEVIISKMEEYHPGFMNCADTYFHFSDL